MFLLDEAVELVTSEDWVETCQFKWFRNPDTGLVEWDEIVKANSGLGGNFSGGYSYTNPAILYGLTNCK